MNIYIYMILMSVVTYLIRVLPLALFQKEIRNPFIQSFLFYVPYSVLAAMTFPAIFASTGNIISATGGILVAVCFAYKEKGLLSVAISACLTVYVIDLCMLMFAFK